MGKGEIEEFLNNKGDFSVKVQISNCLVSDGASKKIIKAGGEIISTPNMVK